MNNQFGKKPPARLAPVRRFNPMNSEVLRFILNECPDIRKVICGGCPSQRLYDKNGKLYNITRQHTLDEVKNIVEEIRKVNAA